MTEGKTWWDPASHWLPATIWGAECHQVRDDRESRVLMMEAVTHCVGRPEQEQQRVVQNWREMLSWQRQASETPRMPPQGTTGSRTAAAERVMERGEGAYKI